MAINVNRLQACFEFFWVALSVCMLDRLFACSSVCKSVVYFLAVTSSSRATFSCNVCFLLFSHFCPMRVNAVEKEENTSIMLLGEKLDGKLVG